MNTNAVCACRHHETWRHVPGAGSNLNFADGQRLTLFSGQSQRTGAGANVPLVTVVVIHLHLRARLHICYRAWSVLSVSDYFAPSLPAFELNTNVRRQG